MVQALQNPLGFGAGDFLELTLAGFLTALLLLRPWITPAARRLAEHAGWSMALLAALPVALRLALLAHHPVPSPDLYDEFSHLLVADTLRHFRLANPTHPLFPFFETFFVLQQPSYSSIYPIGQGLTLAIGQLFGLPWAGVMLCTAVFCALSYWLLRAWMSPLWSLLGGLLAVIEFGPLNLWMNCYWGGALSATAGCLVFGALPRLAQEARRRDGAWLGLGVGLFLLTRPYESIFLILAAILFFLPALRSRNEWRRLARPVLIAALVVTPVVGVTLLQNRAVTGSWTTLPYQLSQQQYGVPAALTIQRYPIPSRALTRQQELGYKMQRAFQGDHPETLGSYFSRLGYRLRFLRFFFLVPLYLAAAAFVAGVRDYRSAWVLVTVLLFGLGTNLFPAFQFHYMAGGTCLFLLISVAGLERIAVRSQEAAWILVGLCVFHFVFWYGMHVFDGDEISLSMRRFETWDTIDHGNARRIAVDRELASQAGKQVVFVRYWPNHIFQNEWVYNGADIDAEKVTWARDLGASENEKLRQRYPNATFWLLEPDADPPKLSRYEAQPPPENPAPAPAQPPPAPETPKRKPLLRLEQVK